MRLLDLAGQRACLNQIREYGPVSDPEQTPPFEFAGGCARAVGRRRKTTLSELEKSEDVLRLQHDHIGSELGRRSPHEVDPIEAGALPAGDGIDLRQSDLHLRFSERTRGGGR